MCVIFTEYVVFAPIHCYAAFTLSVCSFTHFVLFCVFFSFLHKPSDFLHWLCLAQQIYAILSWNSFVVIYAFFGVNFLIQKFCPCKKNDKYEVCDDDPDGNDDGDHDDIDDDDDHDGNDDGDHGCKKSCQKKVSRDWDGTNTFTLQLPRY